MIVLIRRTHLGLSALLLVVVAGMALILWQGRDGVAAFSAQHGAYQPASIVVIDPGHGGEDGGAVAGDGTVESGLNLEIAQRLNAVLLFLGQETEMTRTEDISIYSAGAETLRQKKVSDLENRVALVNGLDNAVLISIHQNSLPGSPKTHGAQVFYNRVEFADVLAAAAQERLNQGVNAGNGKTPKLISDSIYLMKKVTVPAIIVECGFLSSQEDTAVLQTPAYQLRLAAAIAAGYFSTEELP